MLDLFNRQVQTLLERGAPQKCGLDPKRFVGLCEPLKKGLDQIPEETRRAEAPFVICFGTGRLSLSDQMSLVRINDKPGSINVGDVNDVYNADAINRHPFPYLAVGVQLGDRRKRMRQPSTDRRHHEMARVVEVISVGIHFPELIPQDRPVEVVSGGYQNSDKMVAMEIRSSGNPALNRSWSLSWSFHDRRFLYAATCEKRLFLPGYEPEHLTALEATLIRDTPETALHAV